MSISLKLTYKKQKFFDNNRNSDKFICAVVYIKYNSSEIEVVVFDSNIDKISATLTFDSWMDTKIIGGNILVDLQPDILSSKTLPQLLEKKGCFMHKLHKTNFFYRADFVAKLKNDLSKNSVETINLLETTMDSYNNNFENLNLLISCISFLISSLAIIFSLNSVTKSLSFIKQLPGLIHIARLIVAPTLLIVLFVCFINVKRPKIFKKTLLLSKTIDDIKNKPNSIKR